MGDLQQDLARVLVPARAIQEKVIEIAAAIDRDYAGVDEIVIIGILKGAFIFTADLTRALKVPHIVDFMALSSYGKTASSSGEVRIMMDLREPIENRHVIVVEDIIDSGSTLTYLYHLLQSRRPASLRTCVMTRKPRKQLEVPLDYVGFDLPDVWVVGYGLDFADRYRTLPDIAELKREIYAPGR